MKKKMVFTITLCLSAISYGSLMMNGTEAQAKAKNTINGTKSIVHVESSERTMLKQDSLIKWSENKKLCWDYFQGYPDTINFPGFGAVSYTRIPFENFKVYDDSVVMDLPSYFVVNKSWVVKPTNNLLNHEQGHFNITEIFARKMRRDISKYISTDNNASTKFYESILVKYYKIEKSILNEAYDKETDFSRNKEGQKRWDAKIAKMLEELEAYSSSHVVVIRK